MNVLCVRTATTTTARGRGEDGSPTESGAVIAAGGAVVTGKTTAQRNALLEKELGLLVVTAKMRATAAREADEKKKAKEKRSDRSNRERAPGGAVAQVPQQKELGLLVVTAKCVQWQREKQVASRGSTRATVIAGTAFAMQRRRRRRRTTTIQTRNAHTLASDIQRSSVVPLKNGVVECRMERANLL